MIEAITGLAMIWIAVSAIYFFKNRKPKEEKYIWVGPGEDPFKE
jgi:hypothetical protein